MIYSLHNLSFDSFLYDYTSIILPRDIVILSEGIIPAVSKLTDASTDSRLFQLEQITLDKKCIIMVQTDITTNALPYNSVMSIDGGKIASISSEVFCGARNTPSKTINFFESSRGLLGVMLGGDLFYTDLWRIYKIARPTMCYYFCRENSNSRHISMLKAFAISGGRSVVAIFKNMSCIFTPEGKLLEAEFGKLRAMAQPRCNVIKPKLVDKQIVVRKDFL